MTERTNIAKSIAEAKCLGSLVAIDTAHKAGELTDAEKDRLLSGLVPLHEEHNREVAELVRQVLAASEPPPWFFVDYRNATLSDVQQGQLVYGEGGNTPGQVNWGDGSRAGRYRAPSFDERGMVFTGTPALDSAGRRHLTKALGIPAWWAGYLRLKKAPPRFFEATVRTRFDARPGHGPAPIWAGHKPVEQDVEWFQIEDGSNGKVPHNLVRLALHVTFDGDADQTHNANNQKGLRYVHEVDDIEGWHTWTIRQESDGSGGVVWSWDIDGERRQTVESGDLARRFGKGVKHATSVGPATLDISNQFGANRPKGKPGYAWGAPVDGVTDGAEHVTESLLVRDLTGEAK